MNSFYRNGVLFSMLLCSSLYAKDSVTALKNRTQWLRGETSLSSQYLKNSEILSPFKLAGTAAIAGYFGLSAWDIKTRDHSILSARLALYGAGAVISVSEWIAIAQTLYGVTSRRRVCTTLNRSLRSIDTSLKDLSLEEACLVVAAYDRDKEGIKHFARSNQEFLERNNAVRALARLYYKRRPSKRLVNRFAKLLQE